MIVDVLIRGGRVISNSGEEVTDLLLADGVIKEVGKSLSAPKTGCVELDAKGCVVSPGFVDLHTHMREPGKEEAETIETASRAAAKGGYTCAVAMPNTDPAQDSVAVVQFVRAQGERAGLCDVRPSGCITIGRQGETLVPFAALKAAGVHIFTDDGTGVQDHTLMRRAMEYAKDLGVVLAQHCEIASMTEGAVMHEGSCCSHLGLPGWPALAEELMVYRDIELCRITMAPLHILHLSTARSVELVRAAKADGLPVTAEATPHHISLTDEQLRGFDPLFKVNPPLRTRADIDALKKGLSDGTIDAIATDHAPHAPHTKELPLDSAPPGMLGLETALGVVLAELSLDLPQVIERMSIAPARIAGVSDSHGRKIEPGSPANITVFDPDVSWSVNPDELASKSRNTPYVGRTLRGRVRHTILRGEAVVIDGEAKK
jgi:dihydroorotase